jgi:DNA-binding LacI/PurR family transcriptional regulator
MVTTTTIAKYAGVSQTTVSRVLNKPDQVKKETYEKVMAAINEWGYSTEPKEKTIQRKPVQTIRILAAATDPVIFNGALPAIVNKATEYGLFVTIHLDAAREKGALFEELISDGTAGIIISSVFAESPLIGKLVQSGIPYVLLNAGHSKNGYSISMDMVEAGYSAASHLIGIGHQEIAWIGGPLTDRMNQDGLLGFIHALQTNNHKIRKKRLAVTATDKASLFGAFENLLALKKKPTAIVAADEIAIQLMEFCQTAGLKVPEDISIIGLGNSEMASRSTVGLTSVGMAAASKEIGLEAISMLLHAIRDENSEPLFVKKEVALFDRKTTLSLPVKSGS